MNCQIGIYSDLEVSIEQWDTLISLDTDCSPRDLLDSITPLLSAFNTRRGGDDTRGLEAWLVWNLINAGLADAWSFSGIGIDKELRSDMDFFVKISSGLAEVYRIDELLEWNLIARLEVPFDDVEVEAYP